MNEQPSTTETSATQTSPTASELTTKATRDEKKGNMDLKEQSTTEKSFLLPKIIQRTRGAAKTLWKANLGAAILLETKTTNLFNTLVQEGAEFQNSNPSNTKRKATDRIHSIEHRIEQGIDRSVSTTLHLFGMPTRKDFNELSNNVNELSESLTILSQELKETLGVDKEVH